MDGSDSVAPVGDATTGARSSGRWQAVERPGAAPSAPINDAPEILEPVPPTDDVPGDDTSAAAEPIETAEPITTAEPARTAVDATEGPVFAPAAVEAKTRPRRRVGLLVFGGGALVLIVLAGAAGVAVRQRAVNDQRDRAAADERKIRTLQENARSQSDQMSALRSELSARDATIASQTNQIAALKSQPGTSPIQAGTPTTQPPAPQQQQPGGANAGAFGDGLYRVGTDIQAGRYATDGGFSCYWAKLTTRDAGSVVVDHLGAGLQTVTIDSPYFSSSGCGTWSKVGLANSG